MPSVYSSAIPYFPDYKSTFTFLKLKPKQGCRLIFDITIICAYTSFFYTRLFMITLGSTSICNRENTVHAGLEEQPDIGHCPTKTELCPETEGFSRTSHEICVEGRVLKIWNACKIDYSWWMSEQNREKSDKCLIKQNRLYPVLYMYDETQRLSPACVPYPSCSTRKKA